jgi:hypothetical protein
MPFAIFVEPGTVTAVTPASGSERVYVLLV